MTEEVKLWVCPNCHILQGIEIYFKDDEYKARCVNCGVPLNIEDVDFIDKERAQNVIKFVESILPEDLHNYVRYHWLSNKTLGLVFELPRQELREITGEVEVVQYFEDLVSDEFEINVTVSFEF